MTIARDLSKILDANGDLNIDANTLFVDSSTNRVGIGTSSPDYKLDVQGENVGSDVIVRFKTTGTFNYSDAYLNLETAGTSGKTGIQFGDADDSNVGLINYDHSVDELFIRTNASEALRIDSSGNVLVGKTSGGSGNNGVQFEQIGRGGFTVDGAYTAFFNRKTSDGEIAQFRKDGTTVGSIGSASGNLLTVINGDIGLKFSGGLDAVYSCNGSGSTTTNTVNLGVAGSTFKDLYLGGNIYLGGTGSANALDDYEEGTFTPSIIGASGNPTITYNRREGKYFKIGKLVTVFLSISFTAYSGGSGNAFISGLPFTVTSDDNPSNGGGTIDQLSSDLKQISFQTRNAFAGLTPITNGGSTGSLGVVQCSNLTVNSDIRVQIMYYIN